MFPPQGGGGVVTGPRTRDSDPAADDFGMVVRVVGLGGLTANSEISYDEAQLATLEYSDHTLMSNVAGSDLVLRSILFTSTASGRYEVMIGAAGLEVTTHVAYTSEATPSLELPMHLLLVPNGQQVVIRKVSQDRVADVFSFNTTIYYHFQPS